MALGPGTRLGAYEILTLLGAGGMGEVYRARDTKLGRDVALKILPATFTNDAERLARFEREARLLASLNHPHIGAIYGLDEGNGSQFLVLELVDGEGMDRRIARGPIRVDEARPVAKQIAEALEAAHEKGFASACRSGSSNYRRHRTTWIRTSLTATSIGPDGSLRSEMNAPIRSGVHRRELGRGAATEPNQQPVSPMRGQSLASHSTI